MGSSATDHSPDHEQFDAVCIGETMVAFVGRDGHDRYLAVPAGAESNVAVGMARLGCRTRWVSRLGDDQLGRLVEDSISAGGVDLSVVRDGTRPTGVMTKHVVGSKTFSQYYRSESAARALSVDDLDRVGSARWMHVTGITAALSPSCRELVEAMVERRSGHRGGLAFDVNHRPALWPDTATAARVLLSLSNQADVVFIGDDEAAALFGTAEVEALASLILRRDDQELVLKRGAGSASVVTRNSEISEPALPAEVVEATGAGDSFAAGYLAAATFGWPPRDRLRLGHLMASRVLGSLGDMAPPFAAGEVAELSPAALAALWAELP